MEIIVEIGTLEQQELIRGELSFIEDIVEQSETSLDLLQVIVAQDFAATVNQLQGSTDYEDVRGVGESNIVVQAKIVHTDNGSHIVISPVLYTQGQDNSTRLFTIVHELMHAFNKQRFPDISETPFIEQTYLGNLYTLFDEYVANRLAYQVVDRVFPEKSGSWEDFMQMTVDGYKSILTDQVYVDFIRKEIKAFRVHEYTEVWPFLQAIKPCFDQVGISTVHLYSLIHHYPCRLDKEEMQGSIFVNEKAVTLMEYYKAKYEEGAEDLSDGLPLIVEYLTNFGFRFEDTGILNGGYCHILDI